MISRVKMNNFWHATVFAGTMVGMSLIFCSIFKSEIPTK